MRRLPKCRRSVGGRNLESLAGWRQTRKQQFFRRSVKFGEIEVSEGRKLSYRNIRGLQIEQGIPLPALCLLERKKTSCQIHNCLYKSRQPQAWHRPMKKRQRPPTIMQRAAAQAACPESGCAIDATAPPSRWPPRPDRPAASATPRPSSNIFQISSSRIAAARPSGLLGASASSIPPTPSTTSVFVGGCYRFVW